MGLLPLFLLEFVESSARTQDAVATNIPKTSTNHPKYISAGIKLLWGLVTAAVSARWSITAGWDRLKLVAPRAKFIFLNSNEPHIKKHMGTRRWRPEMHNRGQIPRWKLLRGCHQNYTLPRPKLFCNIKFQILNVLHNDICCSRCLLHEYFVVALLKHDQAH